MTCTFISILLNYFDLPSYSSVLRKRYALTMLLMYLKVGLGAEVLKDVLYWGRANDLSGRKV